MIKALFHVNINCKNFERSLAFYKMLGFEVKWESFEDAPGRDRIERGFGIERPVTRAAMLSIGSRPGGALVDLIEWKHPATEGEPHAVLNHAGLCRIALTTADLQGDYDALKAQGVDFLAPPEWGEVASFACLRDPDGNILELVQFPKRSDPLPRDEERHWHRPE